MGPPWRAVLACLLTFVGLGCSLRSAADLAGANQSPGPLGFSASTNMGWASPSPSPEPAPLLAKTRIPAGPPIKHEMLALPGKEKLVPVLTKKTVVTMITSAGALEIEVYPQAAPNAAKRFLALARGGFFDDTPVCRVVDGFVAQFGVNWREPHNEWGVKTFRDDPALFALDRGTLAFAKSGRNKGATQVFINLRENNRLAASERGFCAFGKVVKGMEVVDKFVQVGDPNGGLDQGRLWSDGGTYLHSLRDKPTMIESLSVAGEDGQPSNDPVEK